MAVEIERFCFNFLRPELEDVIYTCIRRAVRSGLAAAVKSNQGC